MADWEEAENDFYQESFAPDLNSVSVDSMIDDSECLPLHSEASLQSQRSHHIYGRVNKAHGHRKAKAKDDLQTAPAPGGGPQTPSQTQASLYQSRKRMRAEVQGLESKDSDSEEAKSARFNENVVTSKRAWEDAAKLRGSCYSLKFKRKIKRQLERQPILIDGSMKDCLNKLVQGWWSFKDAFSKQLQAVRDLATPSSSCRQQRYCGEDLLRRHAFAQERRRLLLSVFISVAATLVPAPRCLMLGHSFPHPPTSLDASVAGSTYTVNSSAEVVLTNNGMLLPDSVENALHTGLRFFNFATTEPLYATAIPLALILIVYLVHGFRLLRARVFHLDSTSLFKQICCSLTRPRLSATQGLGASQVQERLFSDIKEQLRYSWRRWHWRAVLIDLVFNGILLLAVLGVLTYIQQKRHLSSVALHEMVLRFGIVAENAYCFLFGALYLLCRYVLPLLLYWVGGGSTECRVNMFAIRSFLLLSSALALLLFSLISDFPVHWPFVLQKHLCVHVIVDLGLLFLLILLQMLPTCRKLASLWILSPCQRLLGFTVIVNVVQFPFDLVSLSFCLVLLPSLVPLILLRNVFSCTLSFIGRLKPALPGASSEGGTSAGAQLSVQNLCFLEILNTALCLALALAAQYLLLQKGFSDCFSLAEQSVSSVEETLYLYTGFRVLPFLPYISLLALMFFFAKSLVHRHEGDQERHFLKQYLHETNEDKEFQRLKQSQWFPNCQCFSPVGHK